MDALFAEIALSIVRLIDDPPECLYRIHETPAESIDKICAFWLSHHRGLTIYSA
jgi:hypothetical protein